MCTAISYQVKDHYFGRTLDLEYSYNEKVTVCPRNFPLHFRSVPPLLSHFAFIGMAALAKDYPLYYDGVNEHGLCIAGLNFPGNAVYKPVSEDQNNIAHFELIPWILGTFKTVDQLCEGISNLNISDISYSEEYPLSDLHWIVSDKDRSVVIEQTLDGLFCYENPVGVLANNPPFPYQLENLKDYLRLTNMECDNKLPFDLKVGTRGTGMLGLPGDLTSKSRFARACLTKLYSVTKDSESAAISQFFHILGTVSQTQGCVRVGDRYVKTVYTCCCNANKGIYYYTTYENNQITGIRLLGHNLNGNTIIQYPLVTTQQFNMEN